LAWNGQTITASGTYRDTLNAANGCDSIVTLNLIIGNSNSTYAVSAAACNIYNWNGQAITTSGVYRDTLISASGCDSIVTLNLTILTNSAATVNAESCNNYIWNGQTFTSSGTYIDTLIAANGCDSIVTLRLTIKPKSFSTFAQSICDGQTYDGYSNSGTYIDTLVAANGCDSIRTLQLNVLPKSFSTFAQSICDGQTYDGHGSSGTYYIDTLVASNGCDSIITLQLTVLPKPAPYLGADTALCTGNSIQLYPGEFLTYTWQDGSAQNHFTVTQPGLYSVIVSNSCGSGSDEILIKEGICDIYFPLAFTPNNDGKNDLFKILGAQNLKEYHLAVYNRYGQKVFETNDYTKGWTGNVKGQLQNTGVYVWYCNFKKSSSQENIVMKGTVVLIR
jgi:hypothetical protein